jgi:hypothetical protein
MLAGIRRALAESLSQEVTSVFGRTQVVYATSLLSTIAREAESAADNLVRENAALAELLHEAAAALKGAPGFDARLVEELASVERPDSDDLRLSALRTENARLVALLIRLQEACEAVARLDLARRIHRDTLTFLRRRTQAAWR